MTKQTTRKILTGEEIDALETLINDCGIACTMEPVETINSYYQLITANTAKEALFIKNLVLDLCYGAIGPSFGKHKHCVIVY